MSKWVFNLTVHVVITAVLILPTHGYNDYTLQNYFFMKQEKISQKYFLPLTFDRMQFWDCWTTWSIAELFTGMNLIVLINIYWTVCLS